MSSSRRPVPLAWLWALVPVLALAAWFVVARREAASSDDLIVESPAIVLDPLPVEPEAAPAANVQPEAPAGSAGPLAEPADTSGPSAALAADPGTPGAEPAEPPVARAEDPPLDGSLYSEWTTFDDAVRQSRANGKPVLIAFHADWNEGSEELRRQVLDDVAAGLTVRATVIPVLLVDRTQEDGANGAEWLRLQKRFGVSRLPALVVYSPGSTRVQRQQGWHGAAVTLQWIGDAAAAVK